METTCLFCKSNKIRTFVYGELSFTEKELADFQKHSIAAGCITNNDSPTHHCDTCNRDFGNHEKTQNEGTNRE